MRIKKIKFKNSAGDELAARLEFPETESVKGFALFSHCFTSNKNLTAVRNIGRAHTKVVLYSPQDT